MAKHIRCADCKFVQEDEAFSDNLWTAYQCGNHKSEFHRSLLNITINGDKQKFISWRGCVVGERKVAE